MKTKLFMTAAFVFISLSVSAQGGWNVCNTPVFYNRVDDVFMVNSQIGYAVCGDGQIIKTTDGGNNWFLLQQDSIYHRSVEFINEQKGFVGSFYQSPSAILMRTVNGGANWTDLTSLLDPRARKGICGLAVADSNTIYGCGNWWQDSAYIVKSIDGGDTWSFIDMHTYASSLIDMYFLNKDTGFATGRGPMPLQTAVILYTTDGGQSWTYTFQNTVPSEYCWKIQCLTEQIYFASIADMASSTQRILKSTDGGMTWNVYLVPFLSSSVMEGIGFIDSLTGWAGGGNYSFESTDGGLTWDTVNICPGMNRVFKVNDSLLFASGEQIWKYSNTPTGTSSPVLETPYYASITCHPNPAGKNLNVDLNLSKSTRVLIALFDEAGKRIKVIDNANKPKGIYKYLLDTSKLRNGIYYVVLKTHEDDQMVKVVVTH